MAQTVVAPTALGCTPHVHSPVSAALGCAPSVVKGHRDRRADRPATPAGHAMARFLAPSRASRQA
eukprot:6516055-Pyramimonas_sp.AAC.1